MKTRSFVILDDYFVKDDLFSAPDRTDIDIRTLGGYFEVASGSPFLAKFFSTKHIISEKWMRTADIQITYSRWLYYAHLAIIALVAAKYVDGLSAEPLVYSLGSFGNICLLLVLSYHVLFFFSLNYRPAWFEQTVIFHSPFAWAAIWLLILHGDHGASPTSASSGAKHPGASAQLLGVGTAGGAVHTFLDRRVSAAMLLLMHAFIWYMRRTVIGVVVFERKIRAASFTHWSHRFYSVLAALFISLLWKWYPYLSVCWDLYRYPAARDLVDQKFVLEWVGERHMIGWAGMVGTMLVAGGTHILWYSFISYAYHMIMWKEYLREGLAIWVVSAATTL
ncbi:hypothetical protein GQ54DRAFT_54557 [Martensiomyces pterosporus]|nr:hypothetical protein GQ54DRAFT_54557 [Martensiomyces pterosporus]